MEEISQTEKMREPQQVTKIEIEKGILYNSCSDVKYPDPIWDPVKLRWADTPDEIEELRRRKP